MRDKGTFSVAARGGSFRRYSAEYIQDVYAFATRDCDFMNLRGYLFLQKIAYIRGCDEMTEAIESLHQMAGMNIDRGLTQSSMVKVFALTKPQSINV